jgi:nucleotide-binding universal stress UspA family protein
MLSTRTVVVGYDGSEAAQRALACAADAAGDGGHVVVVVASSPPSETDAHEPGGDPTADDVPRLLADASALLAEHDISVSTWVQAARPAEALVEAARRVNATLIAVGARGDSYLARALRGSVAERLIASAPCDLLIAR